MKIVERFTRKIRLPKSKARLRFNLKALLLLTAFIAVAVRVAPLFDKSVGVVGQVENLDGTPAEGIKVWAQSQDSRHWSSAVTDSSGRFQFQGMSENTFNLFVDESQGVAVAVDGLVVNQRRTQSPKMVLTSGALLTGQLVDADTGVSVSPGQPVVIGLHGPSRPQRRTTLPLSTTTTACVLMVANSRVSPVPS